MLLINELAEGMPPVYLQGPGGQARVQVSSIATYHFRLVDEYGNFTIFETRIER
jgi:hypothetical protein